MVILIAGPALAETFYFSWDYDSVINSIDGFRIYQSVATQDTNGSFQSPAAVDNIAPDLRATQFENPGEPGAIQKYCYVIRAFAGEEESENSNAVCYKIDNTPLDSPREVTGSYGKDDNSLKLDWIQNDLDRTKFWKVYYRHADQSEFTELIKVDNSGQAELTVTAPADFVAQGEAQNVYFALVAFKNAVVFSPNSDEIMIRIDRRTGGIDAPTNFKISLQIQLQ